MDDIQPYQFEPEETWQEEDDSKWLKDINAQKELQSAAV